MKMIKELLEGAKALGACRKTDGIDTLDKLVALYESPQGREFCMERNYPSRQQWTGIRAHWGGDELSKRNIYIDAPAAVSVNNAGSIVAVGCGTCLHATLSGADEIQRIIALCGANVTICAENYAVFEVINDGTASVAVEKKDSTVVEL